MLGKIALNYSPNFTTKKRIKKNVRHLIFHYTGMSSESKAIKRLIDENHSPTEIVDEIIKSSYKKEIK